MGEEIATSRFSSRDFDEFTNRLREETRLLKEWFADGKFEEAHPVGGFEVEAWLVDREGLPAPINECFLERLDDPLVVPELSRFNIELNTPPQVLAGPALSRMQADLERTMARCDETAGSLDAQVATVGILPTVRDRDLTVANMSNQQRYRALNDQVLRMRHGRPIRLDIQGHERLQTEHRDVMLEAATTSFQIHAQVDPAMAVRYYNAAMVAAAPMVAAAANSPFLFGRDLWDETRIPLFEQSVNTCDEADSAHCPPPRVTFGDGYVKESLFEYFSENLGRFPILLPVHYDTPLECLSHLRLHNGTIWRWNRPLIGFADDQRPHLRIEHRVVPAGPSVCDAIANAALFFGLMHGFAAWGEPAIAFADARENFYSAARHGLAAELRWRDGVRVSAQVLLLENLIPVARQGLLDLGLDRNDVDAYMEIVNRRVASGRNGASWQRAYRARYGCSMSELTAVYLEYQRVGKPVHEWAI